MEQYGSWALVTGATDGIGKAFARQLAQEGLNLILVGRNPTKLDTVSSEILAEFPDTKVSSSSSSATAGVEPIQEATKGLDVGVLINNVGITYPSAKFFHEVEENVWMEMVRVNLEGTTRVTKAVLPGMVRRRRGAIVNVGSGAAVVVPSHPLFTIYAATKAYIDQLSRSLYVEYKPHGIDVQCQVPLYVATKMTSRVASVERTSLFIPSPEDYVKSAIRCIGYEPRCTPYWAHSLQWFFARLLPDSILDAWRLSIGISRREAALININQQRYSSYSLYNCYNGFVQLLKTQPLWVLVLFGLGSLSVLKCSLAVLRWVYVSFLRPGKNLKKYGSWALVTGPTDGIGKGFAFQLARKGLNLVLVGRNLDKLNDVSGSIQSKYSSVQIKTVVVDFSGDIDAGIEKIKETIEGLDVGVLINNVGVSYPYARFFHEVDEDLLKNLIKVNVEGTTKVTQAVLPGMLKRKKGAITNSRGASMLNTRKVESTCSARFPFTWQQRWHQLRDLPFLFHQVRVMLGQVCVHLDMSPAAHHIGPIPFSGDCYTLCQNPQLIHGGLVSALRLGREGSSRMLGRLNEQQICSIVLLHRSLISICSWFGSPTAKPLENPTPPSTMAKPIPASDSDPTTSVFVDTSLDTHLALFVTPSDTVSDLKKKILEEHPRCFPKIGRIEIHALKVKRRGRFYHLSDSMIVKSVFLGVQRGWFITVDASRVEESPENSRLANRSHLRSDDLPLLLTYGGELSVSQDERYRGIAVDHQRGLNTDSRGGKFSTLETTGDYDLGKGKSLDKNEGVDYPLPLKYSKETLSRGGESRSVKGMADVEGSVHGKGALESGLDGKRKPKRKRQSESAEADVALQEGASVPESAPNESWGDILLQKRVLGDAEGVVLPEGRQHITHGQEMVALSDTVEKAGAVKENTNVTTAETDGPSGVHVACENDNGQHTKDVEAISPPKPPAKRRRKNVKEKGHEAAVVEDRALISDLIKESEKCVGPSIEKRKKEEKPSDTPKQDIGKRPEPSDNNAATAKGMKDAKESSSSEDAMLNGHQRSLADNPNRVEEEGESSLLVSSKTIPPEICSSSSRNETETKAEGVSRSSNLPEVGETGRPEKSSKRRRKPKATLETQITSATEHGKDNISLAEPLQIANEDHSIGKNNESKNNMLSEDGREETEVGVLHYVLLPVKEKCSDPDPIGDGDAATTEGLKNASKQATSSSAQRIKCSEDVILNDYLRAGADQIDGVEDKRETSVDVSSKNMTPEICQTSNHYESETKIKEGDATSNVPEVGKPMDSGKSSKKGKKSRKTTESAGKASVIPAAEHGKISSLLAEHHRAVNEDHSIGKSKEKKSNILQEDGKDDGDAAPLKGTKDASKLPTSAPTKGIKSSEDAIQNVVESLEQINETEFKIEGMGGKLKRQAKKKGNSDVKSPWELQAKNGNANAIILGIGVVRPHHADIREENTGMMGIGPKGLGVAPDTAQVSMHRAWNAMISEPHAVTVEEICNDPVQIINGRPSSPGNCMGNLDAATVEDAFKQATSMPSETCQTSDQETMEVAGTSKVLEVGKALGPGKPSERRKRSRKTRELANKAPAAEPVETSCDLAEPLRAINEDHSIGKSNIRESNMLQEEPADPGKPSKQTKNSRKSTELASEAPAAEPVETSSSLAEPLRAINENHAIGKSNKQESNMLQEPVKPGKPSKRTKKSKKTTELASEAPAGAVVETKSSLAEPLRANEDQFIGKSNGQESDMLQEDRKTGPGVGTSSSFLLDTDKEIDDVIQSVVGSLKQIDNPQLNVVDTDAKVKKRTKKKQKSDAISFKELQTKINSVDLKDTAPSNHDTREVDSSSKKMKLTKMVDSSNLVFGIDGRVENDSLGNQFNSVTLDQSQVPPVKSGVNSDKKRLEGVVNGFASKSSSAGKSNNDLGASCENDRINFRNYFMSSQQTHETVLLEKESKAIEAGSEMKSNKKKLKLEEQPHGPSPNLQRSQKFSEANKIRAKPQASKSGTTEFQQSASGDTHKKFTLEPNKKLPKSSGSSAKSSEPKKINSNAKASHESNTFKAFSSTTPLKKDKEACGESNVVLESSTVSRDRKDPDNGKASIPHSAGFLDSSKHGKSLIGKSSKISDDDSHGNSGGKGGFYDSDASTRTPSDSSMTSDYSDGESSAGLRAWPWIQSLKV
ncbi:hypothetical protein Tsubulata_041147 [Turnera subulata]|uniref:Very-long-chain 3-oxoacyl-CoA reductase n=1 Tax=Turnera subulata TaxID=218843 RepID=A0A9Q0FC84_9ROSI|nr:hypothetical protein Tsubulata_041147 [Turnera subulata]